MKSKQLLNNPAIPTFHQKESLPSQLVGSHDLYKPRHKLTRNGERHNTKSPTCRYFTFSGKAFTLQQTI